MTKPKRIDAATTLMLALTGLMTLTIFAVIYLVLFLQPEPTRALAPSPPAATGDDLRCDASQLETSNCPDHYYCNFNTCVQIVDNQLCGEGESCRECDCADGLVCHHNRCVNRDRVNVIPLVCQENPQLAAAVRQLAELCAARKKNVDDIVSSGACSVADWEALALNDEHFDLMLAAFPNRFAVHFPIGRPSPKRRDWPAKTEREHALKQLRAYREPLTSAKQLFVIGRASPDGDPDANHILALSRMTMVSELIRTVIFEDIPETKRDAIRVRIRSFTVPTSRPILPERYIGTYLANPAGTPSLDLEPLVTWDPDDLTQLKDKLADQELLAKRSGSAYQSLFNTVNRVVLVIPIPCLGDEYVPPNSDIAPPTGGGP